MATHLQGFPAGDLSNASNPIFNTVCTWAVENKAKIARAFRFKGGWEGWAQVEVAMKLEDLLANKTGGHEGIETFREEKVYANSANECDFIVRKKAGEHYSASYIVELKCESVLNYDGFISGVKKDMEKVGSATMSPNYSKPIAYVIAISTSPTGADKMRGLAPKPFEKVIEGGLAVFMWYKQF